MTNFIQRVLRAMLDSGIPLEQQVLVLPSRRAITFFKTAVKDELQGPSFLPSILTMEDLARDFSGLQPMNQIRTALELYKSYRAVFPGAEPFETFERWTGAILRDFSTIDTYLIDPTLIYRDLRLLKEINEWSFASEELLGDHKEFNEFWKRLGALYVKFNEELRASGQGYSGMLLREAVAQLDKRPLFEGKKRVHIAGFNAMSRAEAAILDHLHDEERLRVHWDSAPFYVDNEADPAGHFIRKWSKQGWEQSFGQASEQVKKVTVSAHPHVISQVQWAGSILAQTQRPASRVAVVLADEKLLTPLLDQFPLALEHVNITIGISYRETSVFKFLSSYMSLHTAAQLTIAGRDEWSMHHEELRRWAEMASHYKIISAAQLQTLEHESLQHRKIFFSSEDLQAVFGAELCERLGLGLQTPQSLIDRALSLLAAIKSKDQIVMGVAEHMSLLLGEAREIVEQYSFIDSVATLWRSIRGGLGRERISFVGEPLRGLQVMGLLETRALDFDEVILLGANEGALPKAQRFDTFLPHDLRGHYKLPTQREEDAVFAYYFFRLIQGAERIHIAYTAERDELGGGEQSRYIAQLLGGLPQKSGLYASMTTEAYTPKMSQIPSPDLSIEKSAAIRERIRDWYINRGVSFSRLSEHVRCPLDFYYKTLLRLGEQAEVEEELGASELGDVVHEVLDRSFQSYINKGPLSSVDIQAMEASAAALLDEVFEEKKLMELTKHGESALVKEVAAHMLSNFWKRETERVTGQSIVVKSLEDDWEILLPVMIGGQSMKVKFKAKMDRVEQHAEGLVLIDYKTGKVKSDSVGVKSLEPEVLFNPDKSKALQLLYYTWFYYRMTGDLATAGIISLVGLETEELRLKVSGSKALSLAQIEEFEGVLFAYLDQIYSAGRFEHNKDKGYYCSYCIEKAKPSWG